MKENEIMTPEEFEAEMRRLYHELLEVRKDEEIVHIVMDRAMLDLLRSLGYGAGCDIFDETSKWYS